MFGWLLPLLLLVAAVQAAEIEVKSARDGGGGGGGGSGDNNKSDAHKSLKRRHLEDLFSMNALRGPYDALLQVTNGLILMTSLEPLKEITKRKKVNKSRKQIVKSIPFSVNDDNDMAEQDMKSLRQGYNKLLKKGDSRLAVGDVLLSVTFQPLVGDDLTPFTVLSVASAQGSIKFDPILDSVLMPPDFFMDQQQQQPSGPGFQCVVPEEADVALPDSVNTMPEESGDNDMDGGGSAQGAAEGSLEGAGQEDGMPNDGGSNRRRQQRRRLQAPEGVGYTEWRNIIGVVKAWGQIKVRALASTGCEAEFTATFQAAAAFPFVAEPRTAEPNVVVCCAKKENCECTDKDSQVIPNAMECGQSSKAFTIVGRIGLSWLSADVIDYPGEVSAWVCADGSNGAGNF